ncbi:MAG TPA: methyltransferase domain-containing protein [Opitutaceae bacterium]|nr:methyltransferase domain-containing protein [Opitutaceae bacterium]
MKVPPQLLSLLRDPVGLEPLQLEGDHLINPARGRRYPIVGTIPSFVVAAELGPQNSKFQRMYDRMARIYDLGLTLGNLFYRGKLAGLRRQLAARLALKPGDRVLYTSIGTGADLPYWSERVVLASLEWVGLDLSLGMLRRCQARMRSLAGAALLVQANAERLPLADRSFDVVLHVGGINFFDQPAVAVQEMLRVAKDRARLLIVDETNQVAEKSYRKNPLTRAYFRDTPGSFNPRDWVPPEARDVAFEEVFDGRAYVLTFRAPVR